MRIVVVGCGRAGAELATRMARRGHEVSVVDGSGAAFGNLPPDFRGRTIQGDALAEGTLESAGAREADGLAAVTASDSVNAVVAHAARVVFGVKRVVVRGYAPSRESIHEAFGHEAISSTAWGAKRLEELLDDPAGASEASVGSGEVKIYPVPAREAGRDPAVAAKGAGCVLVAVTRGEKTELPPLGFRTEPGDVLHVAATSSSLVEFRRRLASAERG